jgi:3-methyladenine DNA glycosylase AlkD
MREQFLAQAMKTVEAYIHSVVPALEPLRDDARAAAMAAYMKDRFPFLGIPAPARRLAVKAIPKPDPGDVHEIVRALWLLPEREYHYAALDVLDKAAKKLESAATLELIEELALAKSWWDSVDALAGIGGGIIRRTPEAPDVVRAWSAHGSFWVNRLAILHQNGWGEATDRAVLFRLCLAHAGDDGFFVRKAIGWALRDYARTNPVEVSAFVEANRSRLSPLSAREALKNIAKA